MLRDRSGVEHPLRADLGCRNTVFNGTAQTGVEGLPSLLSAGVRSFRLELLEENAAETQRRVQLYADALAGDLPSREVWSQERIEHRLGVTRGSLRESIARKRDGWHSLPSWCKSKLGRL